MLQDFDFGQLIAPGGPDRDLPIVVPTHFIFDGDGTLELHRPTQPGMASPHERPRALLTVDADYVCVPAAVNTDAGDARAAGLYVPAAP